MNKASFISNKFRLPTIFMDGDGELHFTLTELSFQNKIQPSKLGYCSTTLIKKNIILHHYTGKGLHKPALWLRPKHGLIRQIQMDNKKKKKNYCYCPFRLFQPMIMSPFISHSLLSFFFYNQWEKKGGLAGQSIQELSALHIIGFVDSLIAHWVGEEFFQLGCRENCMRFRVGLICASTWLHSTCLNGKKTVVSFSTQSTRKLKLLGIMSSSFGLIGVAHLR